MGAYRDLNPELTSCSFSSSLLPFPLLFAPPSLPPTFLAKEQKRSLVRSREGNMAEAKHSCKNKQASFSNYITNEKESEFPLLLFKKNIADLLFFSLFLAVCPGYYKLQPLPQALRDLGVLEWGPCPGHLCWWTWFRAVLSLCGWLQTLLGDRRCSKSESEQCWAPSPIFCRSAPSCWRRHNGTCWSRYKFTAFSSNWTLGVNGSWTLDVDGSCLS